VRVPTRSVRGTAGQFESYQLVLDGNEAAARVAHKLADVIAIYPITPASATGELADTWAAAGASQHYGYLSVFR
jgi:pyruvate-ferredoxin/flavodoxin oxidoreductase